MIKIDLRQNPDIGFDKFNDGHIHFNLERYMDSLEEYYTLDEEINVDIVRVTVCLKSSDDVIKMMMVSNSIDRNYPYHRKELFISYMIGARYDRIMKDGDSLDIEVYANIINSLNFHKVWVFHPHSDVTPALIKNSEVIFPNYQINESIRAFLEHGSPMSDMVLISPDAGATKHIHKLQEVYKCEVVQCIKRRDPKTGKPSIVVMDGDKCKGKSCLVVDDICDGGATFIALSDVIRPYEPKKLGLYVSHGIFSNGYDKILEKYDNIFTTNSYKLPDLREKPESLKLFNFNYEN